MNLADFVQRNAGFLPDKIAVRCEGRATSYRDIAVWIDRVASGLQQRYGIGRGDRIAHLGANSTEFLVLVFAAARVGAIVVPINWRLALPEQVYVAEHAGPKLLVVDNEFAERAPALVAASGCAVIGLRGASGYLGFDALAGDGVIALSGAIDDPLFIIYTSGTTGRPKGAILSQRAIRDGSFNSWHMHAMTYNDHVLACLPMFHVGGLHLQVMPALLIGATVTALPKFTPLDMLAAVRTVQPTLSIMVPSMIEPVLTHPDMSAEDWRTMRSVTTGSTMVPDLYVDRCREFGIRLIRSYGATETGPAAVYERADQPRTIVNATGLAGVLTSARVVDDAGRDVPDGTSGEILLRGGAMLSGYWRDPEATQSAFVDGWFRTGDIATRTSCGQFVIHDRKRNVIISGGENVYAAEVERVINDWPQIAECGVVGRADARWQEVPVAFVVIKPGVTFDRGNFMRHLETHLAGFKVPKEIVERGELPKTALGKVQHGELRASLVRQS